MAKTKPRTPRLGKGLSSLMAQPVKITPDPTTQTPRNTEEPISPPVPTETVSIPEADRLQHVLLDRIVPNRHQPRHQFEQTALDSLAASIRSEGVMQPLVVRPVDPQPTGDITFELVAGERRWRAARIAGLQTVPVLVRDLTAQQSAEWALVENLQREDLNAIERAQAFATLVETFKLTHEQVAHRVGVERPTISNLLRLLGLCDSVKDFVRQDHLSAGQGRALAAIDDPAVQEMLAQRAIKQQWSVRKLEQQVRQTLDGQAGIGADKQAKARGKAHHLTDLGEQISHQLGTKVKIKAGRKKGAGSVTIDFYSLDEFDQLMAKLGVSLET